MAFPIKSKALIVGLIILVIVILLALAVVYLLSKVAVPGQHTTSIGTGYNRSGYNTSGYNSTGFNSSGYNRSGYNSSLPIVTK